MLKTTIQKILKSMGYEFRKLPPDPFSIQKKLISDSNPLTIFDVGAHHGETAKKYNSIFPEATIYSFEAFNESFKFLEQVASKNEQIKPYCTAISNSVETKKFYVNALSATNSLFKRPTDLRRYYPKKGTPLEEVEVNATTIDKVCEQLSISKIDILKMDIQGGEMLALDGAKTLLSQQKIGLIYTEIMFVPHYEGGALFHEITHFLEKYNYSVYDMFLVMRGKNGQLRYGDAIFINQKIRKDVVDRFDPEK